MRFFISIIVSLFLYSCDSSKSTIPEEILSFDNPEFQEILKNDKYEFQLIYTSVQKNGDERIFKSHSYNLDTTKYFYPASTVKMPVAFLAAERLTEIKESLGLGEEISLDLVNDSSRVIQSPAQFDTTTINGKPNINQYIKKIFAVSDNDAYNRLYEFLGSDYINRKLKEKEIFSNSRIRHRVSVGGFSVDEQRHTNPIKLLQEDAIVYAQKERYAKEVDYPKLKDTSKGKAYIKDGKKINTPFDMSQKNFINLVDLETTIQHFIFPENFPKHQRFNLTESQRQNILASMHWVPRKHTDLNYDKKYYYDSYVKFFMYGDSKEPMPDHVKIYNKVGYAYGYLTDVAYIEDTENGISFFLTATILVNENGTFNDNNYEYESLGIPFLAELGRRVYNYELKLK